MKYVVETGDRLPFFAEIPYYLWGEVDYDSDGDCKRPTDRDWSWLEVMNRRTRARVSVTKEFGRVSVESEDPVVAARVAAFLQART